MPDFYGSLARLKNLTLLWREAVVVRERGGGGEINFAAIKTADFSIGATEKRAKERKNRRRVHSRLSSLLRIRSAQRDYFLKHFILP